ncbi:hypothetical protein OHB12_03355 [Nocardia sp. NBC_01730]|nr:hypothetical protein OHB12_03355 [Nocardia sp. NBC_01730]
MTTKYRDLFGCPVEFGCDLNSGHLPHHALAQQIRGRDAEALALAENYLARIGPDIALADHVRGMTHRLLAVNQASLVAVARAMALHPGVVQRRLAEAGTSFEAILDDVRRTMAWQLSATGMQAGRWTAAPPEGRPSGPSPRQIPRSRASRNVHHVVAGSEALGVGRQDAGDGGAVHRLAHRVGLDIGLLGAHPAAHVGVDREVLVGDQNLPRSGLRPGLLARLRRVSNLRVDHFLVGLVQVQASPYRVTRFRDRDGRSACST